MTLPAKPLGAARFTLLNTRPAHQAAELNALVAQANGLALPCPLLAIEQSAVLDAQWAEITQCEALIFTSVNAVTAFKDSPIFVREATQNTPCYAIGAATWQAGLSAGLLMQALDSVACLECLEPLKSPKPKLPGLVGLKTPNLKTLETLEILETPNAQPPKFDSETLLAHANMQAAQVKGKIIGLLKGEGGRDLIATTLQQRGAHLHSVALYKRVCAPFCMASWQAFTQAKLPILVLTSWESFECLARALPDTTDWRFVYATLVFSQRIANALHARGWPGTLYVCSPSAPGIMHSIELSLNARLPS
ncbi:uroporphyrinogen-III synthase [Thiomicrorhabdus aquaedulcis]|uniref:uroporphyrinogen-III synthase n=1 Tax=Thiomicrorhabdus aquaedulcis TaxID=2211106 RepID=UPI000FD7A307|nr:uroporphyrinogen-III synthase [Thiomicrorhabdus aquaedulcis]